MTGQQNGQALPLAQFGYARVGTLDQDLNLQLDALATAGCLQVFEARASGARADKAPGLCRSGSVSSTLACTGTPNNRLLKENLA
ncbi:MAG: hypothetical protein ACREFO_21300 [Acetobacteraceae bacterium]